MKPELLEAAREPQAKTRLRALILEDTEDDLELILRNLREAGFNLEYTHAQNEEEFRAALCGNDFDVVLSDYRLPAWTGIDALLELRRTNKDIPFLLITGTLGEEAAVDCIKQGVTDYILKDHLSRLAGAVSRALAEKALRQEKADAQDALRLSEARNRDLVESSIYGIFRVAADGQFVDANPALLRIIGCTGRDQLCTLNLREDIFRFPERHAELIGACRSKGHIHGEEAEWRRCDGGIVSVRLTLRRLVNPGRPEEIEAIAEDVTELRAMERQLRQAQKFEAIGQLAGGIAHDFNNVVGAILGWAEMGLEQSGENKQVSERFSRIREQGQRAAALTRELLAFARRQVLQPRAVDLNTITSGLVTFLDKVIGKDIEFKFLNGRLDPVKADPTQIEQVLMNLCLNARDAMPEGGRLVIETEMVELDESYCRFYPYVVAGRYVVISVSDTGIGMTTETRERIFEPFFTTKERSNGTGMGLATVYGIVKQHNGFVHVYSEPGHGSLFRVYLPAMEGAVAESTGEKATAVVTPSTRGTETVLLAEDHESIREMARQSLVGLGYRVLAAGDGQEALRLCEYETPAIAILDMIMPKMGGAATAAALTKKFPTLRMVFTSGYSAVAAELSETQDRCRYLQKPYSPSTLGRMIRETLDAK
jgi:PAS domain S-box-containing protein